MRSRAPADKNKKPPPLATRRTPQTILLESPEGSRATPAGALTRTRRQDKNLPDDSARIARGLGGSCRVHKHGVPHGLASQQRLSPSRQRVTYGPTQVSEQQARRAIQSPAERSGRGGATPVFRLQPTSLTRGLMSVSSPPPDSLSDQKARPKTLLPTPTPRLRPGYAKTLLAALLRLAQPELAGTSRPGTPAR